MQQWSDERQQIAGYLLVALCRGVKAIGLHAAGNAINVLEQEGKHWHTIFAGQRDINFVELADVIRAVIGRQRNTAEHNLGACVLERRDDPVEVLPGAFDGKAAKAIVAPEGDDDEGWLQRQYIVKAFHTILCGVAADACVDHVIMKACRIEILLQKIGIAVAGISSIAGGEAVAKGNDDWAVVMWCGDWLPSGSSRRGLSCRFRRRAFAVASNKRECSQKRKKHAGTAGTHHTFNLAERRYVKAREVTRQHDRSAGLAEVHS
jgi:hypothetical protein